MEDGTLFEAKYLICSSDRRHTMGDKNNDFVTLVSKQRTHHSLLIFSIELIGPLIHDDNGSILQEEPYEGDDLFFSSGEFQLIAYLTLESSRVFFDLISETKLLQI